MRRNVELFFEFQEEVFYFALQMLKVFQSCYKHQMNRLQLKKLTPLVNEIFPQSDIGHKYRVRKLIGKGHYGYVAKAVDKKSCQFVAIKKIINVFSSQPQTKRILRQIILLKNLNHPNVVRLIEILIPKDQSLDDFDKIYIVTEYCDTDLRKLFQMEETFLQIDDVRLIMYQIVSGIKYLHSGNVIHRDLTPSNILINGQGMQIKICDLGLARVVEQKSSETNNQESSDDDSLEVNSIKILQQQNHKNQDFSPFQNTDSQSIPNSPSTENQCFNKYFGQTDQSVVKKNTLTETNFTQNQQSNFSENINVLDGSSKKLQEVKQGDKKKKKLVRMNSKRSDESFKMEKNVKKTSEVSQAAQNQEQISQKTSSKKSIVRSPLSKLTLKVTTRWYRAPEVILLQKQYNKPIDIWSLGCLFGELLKMIKKVCYNSMQRFPLFPGKYCYPVSPATLCNINRQHSKQDLSPNFQQDQLFMILSTIGKPNEEDLSFLTDEGAKQYIESIQGLQRKQFRKFFSNAPQQAIDILEKTLVFNPNKRMTIDQIINHPFLQPIRKKQQETQAHPIIMQFEQHEYQLTIPSLRKYLTAEIKHFISS